MKFIIIYLFVFSPRYGGKYCEGESKEFDRCNIEECEDDEKAFRATQCKKYDDEPFKGRYFKWSPVDNRYLSGNDLPVLDIL